MSTRSAMVGALCGLFLTGPGARATEHGSGVWIDPAGDAVVRRTDPGTDAFLPEDFEPIDLLGVTLRPWLTHSPVSNPYDGYFVETKGDLFRLDVRVAGVVSPPGPIGYNGLNYNPCQFGARPLCGFIEIDVDGRRNSGGELGTTALNRYLANVGRFGMFPVGSFSSRMVRDAGDVDSDFWTAPQFERTGGEFALTLCGCWEPTIVSQNGNADGVFDAGETWVVRGRFFQRFESFEPLSGFYNGSDFGLWDPMVDLCFSHDLKTDVTTVSLIFPVTMAGAGQLRGEDPDCFDLDVANQTSVAEALDDLILGAEFATGALGELVEDWEDCNVDDYVYPQDWLVTALIGTAPIIEDPGYPYVWTDTGFNEVFGDLDANNVGDGYDTAIIESAIENDGTDGSDDGHVVVYNFGPAFDVRDLNGDGVIDLADRDLLLCQPDLSPPYGSIDFFDVSRFLTLYNAHSQLADIYDDDQWNFFDVSTYLLRYATPCP